jgi:sugar phosphate isomerase/epimerase
MKNLISISAAPLARLINKEYFDLDAIMQIMNKLWKENVIDGFEFQQLAEWNYLHPPKDHDPSRDRDDAWKLSKKYDVEELAHLLQKSNVPILSIHANRDVGVLLCSEDQKDVEEGMELIREAIMLSNKIGSRLCVFHLWDTWKADLNVDKLLEIIAEMQRESYAMPLTIENMPTHVPENTAFDLVKNFQWITLDLRWAAIYDELNNFKVLKNKILNVHVRGVLEDAEWILKDTPFDIHDALDTILNEWDYQGILTLEPEGWLLNASIENLVSAINSLKKTH